VANTLIHLSDDLFRRLRTHLLPPDGDCEEAAFLFTRSQTAEGHLILDVVDSQFIPPEGFESHSQYYLELADSTRAAVIKRAHDLGAGLIECHSHPMQRGACFSWSDLHGFDEFVPHVLWRLPHRPYAALVFANDSFDGLVWMDRTNPCQAVQAIRTERGDFAPTGLTRTQWEEIYERSPL